MPESFDHRLDAPLVVIDARLVTDTPSGIGVYASEMLARIPPLANDLRFCAIFRSRETMEKALADRNVPNLAAKIVPYGPFSPKSQILLPFMLRRMGASLFHAPNFIMPYFMRGCPAIANIHDIIPVAVKNYAPQSRTSRLRAIYRLCIRLAMSRSEAVVTGSRAARDDIKKFFSPEEKTIAKMRVIYDGANLPVGSAGHAPVKRADDSTSERLVIYVGRMDPYKNVAMLVDAFARVQKDSPFPVRLKIVGPKDPRYPEAENKARELGLNVEFTGFVTDAELAELYRTADLLAHPSLYEGFGLQIVEAMAAGTPVLCTDGGSQPEVAGDAARVVPAGDADSFANAMREILLAPALQSEMRARGVARAPLFTWDATAKATLSLYRELLAKGKKL